MAVISHWIPFEGGGGGGVHLTAGAQRSFEAERRWIPALSFLFPPSLCRIIISIVIGFNYRHSPAFPGGVLLPRCFSTPILPRRNERKKKQEQNRPPPPPPVIFVPLGKERNEKKTKRNGAQKTGQKKAKMGQKRKETKGKREAKPAWIRAGAEGEAPPPPSCCLSVPWGGALSATPPPTAVIGATGRWEAAGGGSQLLGAERHRKPRPLPPPWLLKLRWEQCSLTA